MNKILDNAIVIYNEMFERSELNEQDERIFTGHVSKLYKELNIPGNLYSRIRYLLVSSGSIVFHQRGNYRQLSIIELRRPPTAEHQYTGEDLTDRPPDAMVQRALAEKVVQLEAWRELFKEVNVIEALQDYEKRLSHLEKKMKAGGDGKESQKPK